MHSGRDTRGRFADFAKNRFKARRKPGKSQYFNKVRVVHMKNTLAMSTIEVSEALYESIKELPGISYVSGPVPMEFDPEGNLVETVWSEQG
ncbi:hypothetical protein DWZ40_06100 [Clostridium sp. AF32-12BH]|nr:hypothetical protein DWZ40_06100 [Clostridium sp. AF32-12BH]